MNNISNGNLILEKINHIIDKKIRINFVKEQLFGKFKIEYDDNLIEYSYAKESPVINLKLINNKEISFYRSSIGFYEPNIHDVKLYDNIYFASINEETNHITSIMKFDYSADLYQIQNEVIETKNLYHKLINNDINVEKLNRELIYLDIFIKESMIGFLFKEEYIKKYVNNDKLILKEEVKSLFNEYMGNKTSDIMKNLDIKSKAKNINNIIAKRIIKKENPNMIDILTDNNIVIKTVRINKNNRVAESMSFRAFKYLDIFQQSWEESDLYTLFRNKTFLLICFSDINNDYILSDVIFWKMSDKDLNVELKDVWEHTQRIITNGNIVKEIKKNRRKTNFLGMSDTRIAHVRPHARDKNDVYDLPVTDRLTGENSYMKHGFWLNSKYVEDIVFGNNSYNLNLSNTSTNIFRYNKEEINKQLIKKLIHSSAVFDLSEYKISEDGLQYLEYCVDKKIILRITENKYLTIYLFIKANRLISDGTIFLSRLYEFINKGTPLNTELLNKGEEEFQTFMELKKEINLYNITLNNKEYYLINNPKKLTNLHSVKIIVEITNKIHIDKLSEKLIAVFGKVLTRNQIMNAIRNSGLYYEPEIEFVFKSEKHFWEYIYIDRIR